MSVVPKGAELSPLRREILDALDLDHPRSIQVLTQLLGRTTGSLRPALRDLVADGLVVATEPSSSRNRAYLRVRERFDYPGH